MMTSGLPLVISAEVRNALDKGKAVVALESTIITHGMPWPDNVRTARLVEETVRAEGGVPATIAIIDGKIHVGLDDKTLEWLGTAQDVMKISRADLAFALSAGRHASTTVAATMICAHLAGISVFATGGIGGVHRGVEETMDISADLLEFARTPVVVVCAGAKALLDLRRTLEFLETQGVPVVGYKTSDFPAFWSRSSGLPMPLRAESAGEIAAMIAMRRTLALEGGVVVANPVPEQDEIPQAEIEKLIRTAVEEAHENGVTGKTVTPYLLGRMLELTDGRSLKTNIALVVSNARLATHIGVALT